MIEGKRNAFQQRVVEALIETKATGTGFYTNCRRASGIHSRKK
jgi:hypothetical protein